jgi:hypothetical protein
MSKTLELLNEAMNSIDGNKRGMDAVVGNIEEAIWCVEALLAAAKNLRAAQRAYMSDRGNEQLGRAVGDRARELDELIESDESA